jgi:hypothetical protein
MQYDTALLPTLEQVPRSSWEWDTAHEMKKKMNSYRKQL